MKHTSLGSACLEGEQVPTCPGSFPCRGHLPALEELQLQSATFQQPRGAQLLQQLVMGAAGTLRCLRLDGSNVADLAFLAHATALTRLDLAGGLVPGWERADTFAASACSILGSTPKHRCFLLPN